MPFALLHWTCFVFFVLSTYLEGFWTSDSNTPEKPVGRDEHPVSSFTSSSFLFVHIRRYGVQVSLKKKNKTKKTSHLHMTSQNLTTRFEESVNSHESCRVELIFLPTFAVRGDRNQPVLSTVKMTKEACTSWCCTNIYLFTNKTTTKHR